MFCRLRNISEYQGGDKKNHSSLQRMCNVCWTTANVPSFKYVIAMLYGNFVDLA